MDQFSRSRSQVPGLYYRLVLEKSGKKITHHLGLLAAIDRFVVDEPTVTYIAGIRICPALQTHLRMLHDPGVGSACRRRMASTG